MGYVPPSAPSCGQVFDRAAVDRLRAEWVRLHFCGAADRPGASVPSGGGWGARAVEVRRGAARCAYCGAGRGGSPAVGRADLLRAGVLSVNEARALEALRPVPPANSVRKW